jgi:hypothetical protein
VVWDGHEGDGGPALSAAVTRTCRLRGRLPCLVANGEPALAGHRLRWHRAVPMPPSAR